MHIRPIRDHADHAAALRDIENLWGADEGTEAGDRLDVLVTQVEAYEARRWPIALIDLMQAVETAANETYLKRQDRGKTIMQSICSIANLLSCKINMNFMV